MSGCKKRGTPGIASANDDCLNSRGEVVRPVAGFLQTEELQKYPSLC